jgi:hypothetical protein
MGERLIPAVLKTVVPEGYRGFESLSLRHQVKLFIINNLYVYNVPDLPPISAQNLH